MENTKYSIGLDIGTTSVGWAVIDDNYNLLKKKKKNMFGVYLFEEADTAADRRTKRSARRRLNRRRQRLALLREFFAPEMQKVDPSFFLRLEQSKLNKIDPNKKYVGSTIFNGDDISDSDFYEKYPTIFHLRKAMIEDKNDKFDLRELYLVSSNILKYRGNFTDEAQSLDSREETFKDVVIALDSEYERQQYGNLVSEDKIDELETIAEEETKTASDRQKELVTLLMGESKDKEYKTRITEFVKLLLGLKGNLAKMMGLEAEDSFAIKLSDRNVESDLQKLTEAATAEQMIIFDYIQDLYSKIVLHKILKGEKYLSVARVQSYDKHHEDLMTLKGMWRQDSADHKKEVDAAKVAYDNYINHGVFAEDFYKELQKYLKIASDKEAVSKIESDIEFGNYLPKQRTNQNGAIPFQVHHKELQIILKNQSKFYPFLLEEDAEGLTVMDKILKIHSFRIPYYVGPLNGTEKSNFKWLKRKEDGKIYPWNFEKKVDVDESSIRFISRMTGTDTFLLGEPVVPKYSLLYQKYEVLNELNKIRVNGKPLDLDLKQDIFNDVFKKHRSVTVKTLATYLVKEKGMGGDKVEIEGLSKIIEFASSLSTYIDMVNVFGADFVDNPANNDFLEELATWLTVFEDKKILRRRIADVKDKINDKQEAKLLGLRYSGWGKLSNKLLTEIKLPIKLRHQHEEKELSIMDILWQTNLNLMQIVNDDGFGFNEEIKKYNGEENSSVWDAIDNLAGSPAIKKGIRQTVRVVDDIARVMKSAPDKIYLEFARDEQPSIRTKSRYNQIKEKYSDLAKTADAELSGLMQAIKVDKSLGKELEKDKDRLTSERLFLYFLQGGKSLYSGTPLDITKLNEYEVDHIVPRAYIKDDSIENKALVLKSENQNKTDKLLLPVEYITKMTPTWRSMKKLGLMTEKKFNNLTARGISEGRQKGFINRQLVETRQIIKNVTNIFDEYYGDSGVKTVPVRANLSTDFRNHNNLLKSRNVNDYHHAHDAYLAAFLGTYISKKYPNQEDDQLYKSFNKYLEDVKKQLKKEGKNTILRQSFIIHQLDSRQVNKETGEIIWEPEYIENIRKIFSYKLLNVVKKTEIRDANLFKETIFGPGKKNNLIPLKKGLDPDLYGGYSSQQPAFSVLCDIDGKSKKLVALPVAAKHQIDQGEYTLEEWIKKNAPYKKTIEILIEQVPIYQKVWSKEKGYLILSSPKEIQNGQQLVLSSESYGLLAKLEKMSDAAKLNYFELENVNFNGVYAEIVERMEKYYPFYKSEQVRLAAEENVEAFRLIGEEENGRLEQFNLIEELLKTVHQNAGNGSVNFGSIKTVALGRRSNGYEMDQTYFIYQSPTGLFETRKLIQ